MKKKLPKKVKHAPIKYIFILFSSFFVLIFGILLITAENPRVCANSVSCIQDLSGSYEPLSQTGVFMGQQTTSPSYIAQADISQSVLGVTSADKHIYINLATQHLQAIEDGRVVYDFAISSGKWYSTPTGDFTIWYKTKYTRMEGGNKSLGTYYNLPNVPFTMFFANNEIPKSRGFGIHGAYWHNNFGNPMSHGCINMKIEEAEKLFYWANPPVSGYSISATKDNPGTPVTIFGEAPKES